MTLLGKGGMRDIACIHVLHRWIAVEHNARGHSGDADAPGICLSQSSFRLGGVDPIELKINFSLERRKLSFEKEDIRG